MVGQSKNVVVCFKARYRVITSFTFCWQMLCDALLMQCLVPLRDEMLADLSGPVSIKLMTWYKVGHDPAKNTHWTNSGLMLGSASQTVGQYRTNVGWTSHVCWIKTQQTTHIGPMLVWCWPSVVDGGPTSNQHSPSKQETLDQCWTDVGPAL